jgi:hypothetical protein
MADITDGAIRLERAGHTCCVKFTFDAELWKWPGDSAWHFVTVPEDISLEIRSATDDLKVGFGSVRVVATVGSSTWSTSVFPDSKVGCYVLPMKKPVRRKEDLEVGDSLEVDLTIVERT